MKLSSLPGGLGVVLGLLPLLVLGCSEVELPSPSSLGLPTNAGESDEDDEQEKPSGPTTTDAPTQSPKAEARTDNKPEPSTRIGDFVFTERFHPYREGEVIKGVLFGDHKATIGGVPYTFLDNTEIEFYKEGKVRLARLKANKTVRLDGVDYNLRGGYKVVQGKSDIEFYPSGSVKRAGLSSSPEVVLGGVGYKLQFGYGLQRQGTDISFYGDGRVRSLFLAEDVALPVGGIDYRFKSNVETLFHPNGVVKEGLVSFELNLEGRTYLLSAVRVFFDDEGNALGGGKPKTHPNGVLSEVYLARDQKIVVGGVVYPFGEGTIDFYENGKVKSAFLLNDVEASLGGSNFVLHGGSRVVFHENGAFKAGNVSMVVVVGEVAYRLRGGWVVFSDDGELLRNRAIAFHGNGVVKAAFLTKPAVAPMQGVLYPFDVGEIQFHPTGVVHQATLAKPTKVHGLQHSYVLAEGSKVTFYESGMLSSGHVSGIVVGRNRFPIDLRYMTFGPTGLARHGLPIHYGGSIRELHPSSDVNVRINGEDYNFLAGKAIQFHRNGEVYRAILQGEKKHYRSDAYAFAFAHRVAVNGVGFFAQGQSAILFHLNGVVSAIKVHYVFPSLVVVGGNQLNIQSHISFYDDGKVKVVFLYNNTKLRIGEQAPVASGMVGFHRNGAVKYLRLAHDQRFRVGWKNYVFPRQSLVVFDENGNLRQAEARNNRKLFFDEDGRLLE